MQLDQRHRGAQHEIDDDPEQLFFIPQDFSTSLPVVAEDNKACEGKEDRSQQEVISTAECFEQLPIF